MCGAVGDHGMDAGVESRVQWSHPDSGAQAQAAHLLQVRSPALLKPPPRGLQSGKMTRRERPGDSDQ